MNTQPVGYEAKAFEPRNLVFFFLIAFGLTWLKSALTVILHMKMPTRIADPAILFLLFVGIPGWLAPTLAAFTLTGITEGKLGVKAL